MGAEYESLLFHTSVRWLSKGNMLIRLVRLLSEVIEFIEIQHKKELKAVISYLKFQNILAFLADMFCHLNELNSKLQGVHSNLLGRDKIAAFIAKLALWKKKVQTGPSGVAFPTIEKMSETNGISDVVQSEAVDHISRLMEEFHLYFSGFEHNTPVMAFTRNPFKYSVEDLPEDEQAIQEEFLHLIHDSSAKASFDDETRDKFWAMMQNMYSKVAAKPLALLTAFPSTYVAAFAGQLFQALLPSKQKFGTSCWMWSKIFNV